MSKQTPFNMFKLVYSAAGTTYSVHYPDGTQGPTTPNGQACFFWFFGESYIACPNTIQNPERIFMVKDVPFQVEG